MTKIGVEHSLTDIYQALAEQGFQVSPLRSVEDANGVDFDYCVVTGLDTNVLGIQDTKAPANIIEAHGLTANDIVQEIKDRLSQ